MGLMREPAVAGSFYPANATRLASEIGQFLGDSASTELARSVIAPHAGYVFSGAIAGSVYRSVAVPGSTIVLCPNHTGRGAPQAVWDRGSWRVPGGDVPVDESLAAALLDRSPAVEADQLAHQHEHSIEVHLPFLRARRTDVRIVPICLAQLTWKQCAELGEAVADVISDRRARGEDVLVVASSDMSHYVPATTAERLDHLALDRIAQLDAKGLLQVVRENNISMCGVIPATVALVAAQKLGATTARVTAYGNSGDVSGDRERVVGYAAVIIN